MSTQQNTTEARKIRRTSVSPVNTIKTFKIRKRVAVKPSTPRRTPSTPIASKVTETKEQKQNTEVPQTTEVKEQVQNEKVEQKIEEKNELNDLNEKKNEQNEKTEKIENVEENVQNAIVSEKPKEEEVQKEEKPEILKISSRRPSTSELPKSLPFSIKSLPSSDNRLKRGPYAKNTIEDELRNELQREKEKNEKLKEVIKHLNERNDQISKEIKELKSGKVEEMESRIQTQEELIKHQTKIIESLQKEINALRASLKEKTEATKIEKQEKLEKQEKSETPIAGDSTEKSKEIVGALKLSPSEVTEIWGTDALEWEYLKNPLFEIQEAPKPIDEEKLKKRYSLSFGNLSRKRGSLIFKRKSVSLAKDEALPRTRSLVSVFKDMESPDTKEKPSLFKMLAQKAKDDEKTSPVEDKQKEIRKKLLRQIRERPKIEKPLEPLDPEPYYAYDYRMIEVEETKEDDIEYEEKDGKRVVKCSTLTKLIEVLTSHEDYDSKFLNTFILTYRSYTTSLEVLKKLQSRFNTPPPKNCTFIEFAQFKRDNLDRIRLRVTQTIKYWLENFYEKDFDEQMLEELREFVVTMMNSQAEPLARIINSTLEKVQNENKNGIIQSELECPPIIEPKKKAYRNTLILWPVTEIARQITLWNFNIFSKIEPKECLNQGWNKEGNEAPNMKEMIQSFNTISYWTATSIIETESLKKRIKRLMTFIDLADELFKMNNYHSAFAIVSGLGGASVHRLKKTWGGLNKESIEKYQKLDKAFASTGNFKQIRSIIKQVKPPCIPHIGLYLTDLTFVEEGNPKLLNNKINFNRCQLFAEVIRDMQMYQNTRYAFKEIKEVQEMIKAIKYKDEKELYNLSLEIEPRQ